MREKFYAILLLVVLFVVMPVAGYLTNADYFGYFLAQLNYGHGTTVHVTVPSPQSVVSFR